MTSPAALIGIDWGTTSFRAYRIGADGHVLERKSSQAGILKVPKGQFEQVFEGEVGPWLDQTPEVPIIASGMITSRQGWVEVPYGPCPAGSEDIARAIVRHKIRPGRIIHFVPGLSIMDPDGVPDVLRGEETQIIGEGVAGPAPRLLVLPGTHSKWALFEQGRIVWFATFMTGEVFGVLKEHSILGRMMADAEHDEQAFRRGLAYARVGRGGLLERLFSACTLALFEQLPTQGVASYLSGLLIGTEIREAFDCLERSVVQEITVIGSSDMTDRYLAGDRRRRAAWAPWRAGCWGTRALSDRSCRRPGPVSALWEYLADLPLVAIWRGVEPDEVIAIGRGADRRLVQCNRGAAQLAKAVAEHRGSCRGIRRGRADRRGHRGRCGRGPPRGWRRRASAPW